MSAKEHRICAMKRVRNAGLSADTASERIFERLRVKYMDMDKAAGNAKGQVL